jgi:hypothetical protein
MAVEASAVTIRINVVDVNSGPVTVGVSQNIEKIGVAARATTQQLNSMGQSYRLISSSGTIAGQIVKKSMDEVGLSSMSSVERMRLLTEEAGVRLPRALLKLAAHSELVSKAIGAIGPALMGIGAIQIGAMLFTQLIDGAKKLWDEHLSLTKAAQDYNAEVEKSRQENFGDSHSIETTRLRIDEASDAAINFRKQAEDAQKVTIGWRNAFDVIAPGAGSVWQDLHQRSQASSDMKQSYDQRRLADKLNQHNDGEQYHAGIVGDIEAQHAGDSALRGRQKYNAELQKSIDLAHEETRYKNEQDRILGNPVASDANQREEQQKDQAERKRVAAEELVEQRAQAEELRHIREEALESGLRGSALYSAQEAAAVDDLKQKGIASAQAINDVRQKFHNEEMKRLEDENREVQKMHEQTLLGGLTGVARVHQESQNRMSEVYASTTLNPGQRLAELHDISLQTSQQLQELNTSFADRVNEIISQGVDHQLQGFARIQADAQNQIRQLREQFTKEGGRPADLARGEAGINANANFQASDLARKNAEETEQIESQARTKLLSAEKQQTAAIEQEYKERLEKYKDELAQQEISDDDYNRRVVAAAQQREAELVDAARQAREKMAGEFDSFFKGMNHPLQYLQQVGDKVAGEAAAALVQRAQTHFGGPGAASQGSGGIFGGIFDKIAGTPRGARGAPGSAGSPGGGVKSIALSTAEIHIQSANIGFGASGGAAGASLPAGIRYSGGTYSGGGFGGGGGSTGSGGSYSFGGGSTSGGGFGAGLGAGAIGGAGDVGYGATAPGGMTGGPGVANPARVTAAGAMNDVGQGMSFGKQALSIFGGGSGSGPGGPATTSAGGGDADSIPLQQMQNMPLGGLAHSPSNGGMLGGGGIGANLGGAVSGGLGVYSAVEGNGGIGGALQGGMAGMQLGMSLGGPLGAAIGAAGGAVLGALGLGGREKARVYYLRTVRTGIDDATHEYQTGGLDYLTAYSQMQTLDTTAERTTKQWGPAAHAYYNDTIRGAIHQAEGRFSAMERGDRSQFSASAAQYDIGTDSVPRDGMAMIHENERIFPSDQNERITRALEAGADSTRRPAASAWGGDVHLHVHAIDAKSSTQWLMANKHVLRSAVNESFAENSGGADAGY